MADVSYENVTLVERVLWPVSIDEFDLAFNSLAIRMGEVQREEVLGIDLSAWIYEHAIYDTQGPQVAASAGVRSDCIFIRLTGDLLTVALSGLLLQSREVVDHHRKVWMPVTDSLRTL